MDLEKQEVKQVFVKKKTLWEKGNELLGRMRLGLLLVGVMLLVIGLLSSLILIRHTQNIEQHAAAISGPADGMGMFDSCGTSCFSHLDQLHQAGFTIELDYIIFGWTSINAVQAYAQHAQQDNMKIIWTMKDFYADVAKASTPSQSPEYAAIAQSCGCNDWTSLATYLVNQVKNYPATWGYYVADEPKTSQYNEVSALSSAIHQADPNHPRLIIKDDSLTNGNAGYVKTNLPSFAPLAEVIGEDYYPVSYGQNIGATGSIASAVQSVANSYGKNSTMVLEADSGNGTGILPSTTEMQEMLTMTLQNSQPRLILWYWLYHLPTSQFTNLINAVNASSEYGTCGNAGWVCTTNANLGTVEYTDQVPGDICSINATNANDSRGAAVYCCNGGSAQYGTCGSSGQYKCSSSCSNIVYTGHAVSTQCGINATKAGLARGTKIYCSCLGSNCPNSTPPAPSDPQPLGYLDGASCGANGVSGWTCDGSDYSQALRVDFYEDGPAGSGKAMGSTQAQVTREAAVGQQCGGNTAHGFTYTLPASVADGAQHTIYAYGINYPTQQGGTLLTNSPKTFSCAASTSPTPPEPTQSPTISPSPSIQPSTSPTPSSGILGDLNNDGVVDILDYNIFMSCYGDKFHSSSCLVGTAADLNKDGAVDGIDYNMLIRAMGGV